MWALWVEGDAGETKTDEGMRTRQETGGRARLGPRPRSLSLAHLRARPIETFPVMCAVKFPFLREVVGGKFL